MNLYQLELKRVCKTRLTAILLALALMLAVFMAYLPVTFVGWVERDANGNRVEYTGVAAVQKRREHQVSGTITTEVLQEALAAYQKMFKKYDDKSISDVPIEEFYAELSQYQPFVNDAKEAFADPNTGMAPGVMGLTADDMTHFYDQLPKRLEAVIRMENRNQNGYEEAQAIAQKKFAMVQKPYVYYFGAGGRHRTFQCTAV